jgi:hypothetical protein
MPIEHTCFLSYPHPRKEGSVLDIFVQDLMAELDQRLDGFLPGDVYCDKPRLRPTYNYDIALSEAICRSICLLVVYCPEYARREYCRRELDLMDRINNRRRDSLGVSAGKHHFVALVSLENKRYLPTRLLETSWHVADFSSYMRLPNVGERRIRKSKLLEQQVQDLAEAVRELHDLMRGNHAFGSPQLCCRELIGAPDSITEWESPPFPR